MESNIVNTKIFWQFFSWINQKFCIIYNFSFIHISVPTDSPASIVLGLEGLHPSRGGGDENVGQPAKGRGKKFGQALKGGERISDMNLFSWITEIQCYLEFSWFSWVFYFQVRGGSEKFWMRRKGGGGKKLKTCLLDLRYFGIIRWIKGTHNKSFAHIRWFTRVIRIYWGCIPLSHK